MFERRKIDPARLPHAAVAKWSQTVLDEGFVPLPKRMLRCLSALFEGSPAISQLATVLAIVDYKRPALSRPPSVEFLAFTAGMDVATFKRNVDELQSRGWVTASGSEPAFDVEIEGLIQEILERTRDEA